MKQPQVVRATVRAVVVARSPELVAGKAVVCLRAHILETQFPFFWLNLPFLSRPDQLANSLFLAYGHNFIRKVNCFESVSLRNEVSGSDFVDGFVSLNLDQGPDGCLVLDSLI